MDQFVAEHSVGVVALLGLLFSIVGFLLIQSYIRLCEVLRDMKNDIAATKKEQKEDRLETMKILAEIFKRLANCESDISSIEATCDTSRELCPGAVRKN